METSLEVCTGQMHMVPEYFTGFYLEGVGVGTGWQSLA
jgi:hypothetical protein